MEAYQDCWPDQSFRAFIELFHTFRTNILIPSSSKPNKLMSWYTFYIDFFSISRVNWDIAETVLFHFRTKNYLSMKWTLTKFS